MLLADNAVLPSDSYDSQFDFTGMSNNFKMVDFRHLQICSCRAIRLDLKDEPFTEAKKLINKKERDTI